MSMNAYSLCAYGLWIYPEPEGDFKLELKDDVKKQIIDDDDYCGKFYDYIYDGDCEYDIPEHIEIFPGYNYSEEFLGISLIPPPWENPYKTKEKADADIQKALEALYKNVPPDYAKNHCEAIHEAWIE